MNTTGDAQLVRAAQASDIAALGALLQRYRAQMKAVAVGLLGPHPDTEDAVQDACIQALRRIGDLRDPAAVRAWLVAIVANACRARLRRPGVETSARPTDDTRTAFDTVDQALERTAVRDWVWTALERMPVPLRSVVLLRYFSNACSYTAIAQLCQVPVGTVRSRLHAARAQLAGQLLATAATVHHPDTAHRRLAEDATAAMGRFQATGEATHLTGTFAADLRFTLANGIQQRGRDLFAALLTADFNDGVRARPIRLTAGADLAIIELHLDNPAGRPLHCPPRLTQVHRHNGRRVQQITSHYAADPHAPRSPEDSGAR